MFWKNMSLLKECCTCNKNRYKIAITKNEESGVCFMEQEIRKIDEKVLGTIQSVGIDTGNYPDIDIDLAECIEDSIQYVALIVAIEEELGISIPDEFMQHATADAIVHYIDRQIPNYKGLVLSWFGGEPLLAMDLVEYISEKVIQICKAQKKHL